ncbi:MAG TPA: amidase family protein, partial [Bacillota bacterium]
GGSAAAVAARQAPVALGSDTGGSIRQPAALCGVVGLKPTYGRVSRFGLVAFASSLDQIGPFARTARDAALVLSVIAGHDALDSTSATEPVPDYLAALDGDVRGLRIGVPEEYFAAGLDPGVERAVRAAIERFRDAGAVVESTSLPHTSYALPVYYLIAPAEASSNLARYDGIRYGYRSNARVAGVAELMARTRGEGFGPEVKRRIMLGTYALSAGYHDRYYGKAQQVRRLIRDDFERAFAHYDLLLTPTSPVPAFALGERVDDPLTMYLCDACTLAVNLAGVPGISIPCGWAEGLPVGLQIIGRPFDEATILRAADAYQRWTDDHLRRPPLAAGTARATGREMR